MGVYNERGLVLGGALGEWKQRYPDAFNKEYDPAFGLRFDALDRGREWITFKIIDALVEIMP